MIAKKTKIICTIGPASEKIIPELVENGMNTARLNFSHGSRKFHEDVVKSIRKTEEKIKKPIGILADLQGPKIRTGGLKIPPFAVNPGDEIWLNNRADFAGDKHELGCTYAQIIGDLQKGHTVLIDDGKMAFTVKRKTLDRVLLEASTSGIIGANKGINLPGTKISAPALTPKDLKDLKFAIELGVDFLALSFVRSEKDIEKVKKRLKNTGIEAIAKIERPEALEHMDKIIEAAGGIMIARGDLGVELDTEKVPVVQKNLIQKANLQGKLVITATQMMESMMENPRPTRAEASDVANAVLDGTDAVMLSGETASGKYPVEVVATMSRILNEAEKIFKPAYLRPGDLILKDDEISLGTAAVNIADSIQAKAILTFTRTGYSARLASRFRPFTDIYSFTPNVLAARQMTLFRGVISHRMEVSSSMTSMLKSAGRILKAKYNFKTGDKVLVLAAAMGSELYTTDLLQVYRII